MKILVTTMCNSLIKGGNVKNINIFETVKIATLLKREDHDVTLATLKDTDIAVAYGKLNVNSFDKVLLMNSVIDFPGGEENFYIEGLFEFLKQYKGPIYNLLVDLAIPFKQLYPKIEKRRWCKYKSASEINLDNEFIIISQCRSYPIVRMIYEKSGAKISDIKYVPLNEWVYHTNDFVDNSGNVDLIMGTSFRKGKRRDKYLDYFFNRKDLTVELFGSIKEENFDANKIKDLQKPIFSPKLNSCNEIIEKNSTGFATAIIGDPLYNNNMKTLRIGESLLANCITFIDEEFDLAHELYPNNNFFYVNSGKELEEKIKFLKEEIKYYNLAIEEQHRLVQKIRENNMPKLLIEALK